MATRFIRRYKAEGQRGINTLQAEIYYSLGGMNYFTGRGEKRGYWFSLQPLEVTEHSICFTAWSGVKTCVLPCERQSKKRYEEAKGMLDALIDAHMADFCEQSGITIIGSEYTEQEK